MSFTITEEQIKSIAEGGGKTKIKEMFPEVFQDKLQVGKWYKSIFNAIFFVTETDENKDNVKGYGVNYEGIWINESWNWSSLKNKHGNVLATDEEVESALIAEAKKRGYSGKKIILISGGREGLSSSGTMGNDYDFFPEENMLKVISKYSDYTIFKDGKWAEIIKEKTLTKSQAETYLEEFFADGEKVNIVD